MIVYRTFYFLQDNFVSIFFATTCGTNTEHVIRKNYYKLNEALLTTYSCELGKDERSQIVVFVHYSLQRDCQIVPELLQTPCSCLCSYVYWT